MGFKHAAEQPPPHEHRVFDQGCSDPLTALSQSMTMEESVDINSQC